MNDRQRAKLRMYIVVRGFLDANQTAWNGIAKFVEHHGTFVATLAQLESQTPGQQQPTTGVTADKEQLRAAMNEAALPLVGVLQVLGADSSDNDLVAQSDFTSSDFLYGAETDSADDADTVHALATQHVAALADYGVTAAEVAALEAAVDAFRAKIGAPRQVTLTTAGVTQQIANSIVAIDTVLGKLDNLSQVRRFTNPSFYTGYHNARNIIGPGSDSSGTSDTSGTSPASDSTSSGDTPTDPDTTGDSQSSPPEP